MYLKRIIYSLLFSVFLLTGCKSTKKVTTENGNLKLTAKQLIKENTNKTPHFNTLAARVKLEIIEGENSKSFSISYRMEKDQKIWISGGFGMVKALITPNKVSFYNKLDNTYFDGDYAYLSSFLGTDLDFNKVQNVLLGEALYSLKEDTFKIFMQDNNYVLTPKNQPEAFELFYLLNASHFKINSQQLTQAKEQRILQIDYTSYQEIETQSFPENIKINVVEGDKETKINLDFKAINLNQKLTFPFNIPSGYKEIEL